MMQIAIPQEDIRRYCETQPIRRLSVFGSVLREDFTATSDVDVLVEFLPEARVTYFDLFYMQEALEGLIGREVDLLTPGALSEYFRDDVMAQAVAVYERAG